ncbi:MAG: EscU/YscU/HrcU family type III secretion system export apparatus switch protein [Rhodospirillales bacterium]|nr:EscU/YscU/HrcU family type III secretion system export apparatus switch protein [Rhodospirillales bacterium]
MSRRRKSALSPHEPAAVALDYEWPHPGAPTVVATGRGELADRIVAVAKANDVPIRQDADLVEVLSCVDLGEAIPLEAFAAVAEILAYLYRLNGTATPAPDNAERSR